MIGQSIAKAWNGFCTLCASRNNRKKNKRQKNEDDSLLLPFLSPRTISNLRLQSQAHLQQPLISEIQCGSPVKIADASSNFLSALSQAVLQVQVCPHCRKEVFDDPSIECMQQYILQSFNNLLLMRHIESNLETESSTQTKVATVRRSCHQMRGVLASSSNTSCEQEEYNSASPGSSEAEFLGTSPCDNGLFPDNSITVFHSQEEEDLLGQEEEDDASSFSDDYAKSYVTYLENLTFSCNNDKLPLCLTVSSSNNFA